jgi:hypothetical protein
MHKQHPTAVLYMEKALSRYYIYKFLTGISVATTSFFFTFFYLKGFPIEYLVYAIFTYAVTCLILLPFIPRIISRLGLRKTFYLHTVFVFFKIISVFLLVEYEWVAVFFLLQFFNAFNVMFMRIPLETHFSLKGSCEKRGRSIALENTILIVSGALGGVFAGHILDTQGILFWEVFHFGMIIVAAFVMDISDEKVELYSTKIKEYKKIFPKKLEQSLFFTNIFYPFTRDFLPMWIIINLGSFTIGAYFLLFRFVMSIFLNNFIGKIVDLNKAHSFYVLSVVLSSIFYLLIPFVTSSVNLFLLSFSLGLFAIIIEIPFRRTYYLLSKANAHTTEFMIYKELIIQKSLFFSCVIALVLLSFVTQWEYLLALGSLSSLAFLYLKPNLISTHSQGNIK